MCHQISSNINIGKQSNMQTFFHRRIASTRNVLRWPVSTQVWILIGIRQNQNERYYTSYTHESPQPHRGCFESHQIWWWYEADMINHTICYSAITHKELTTELHTIYCCVCEHLDFMSNAAEKNAVKAYACDPPVMKNIIWLVLMLCWLWGVGNCP